MAHSEGGGPLKVWWSSWGMVMVLLEEEDGGVPLR